MKERKVKALEPDALDAIAVGNIGCMMQIGSGTRVLVFHMVELLGWVTGGPMPHTLEGMTKEAIATVQLRAACQVVTSARFCSRACCGW